MTEQEKQWFDALKKDRSDNAHMLEKPSMRGVQRSVVDKYSDQAHFIYELLQNADDVKATSARFRLKRDGLFFIHNGSVRFSVSNPQTEDADTHSGTLGHINSITSIANSNKAEASIGKFGVGFKAVFQYTQTPHIYDPGFQFKIERFIVPHLLDADLDWRDASETVFWFPFDHRVKTPEESYEDVLEKLRALDLPVLFLSHLESVAFEGNGISGTYSKSATELRRQGDMAVQRLTLTLDLNGEKTIQRLLTFARSGCDGLPYCIGYALGKDGKPVPIDRPAFCFFPTKEVTNLNFIIHAPFLLTDSREGVKAGEKHNQELIHQLAQLAAESLPILRDEGLIDDGLLDVIPYDESKLGALDDRRKISFRPFYAAIKRKLQIDTLLPAANGTCSLKSHSYWASDTELVELLSDRQLAQLTGTSDACWVFRSRGKKEVLNANRTLADFIDGGDAREWARKEPNLIVSSLDPEAVLKKITSDFIAAQSHEWLHKFYGYLSERSSYQKLLRDKPIFLDRDGNAVPAFDAKEQHILFLPDNDIEGYTTVNDDLLSNKATREFIDKFGIRKPSLRDEIYNQILPAYARDAAIDTDAHFSKFFRYFKECRNEEVAEFVALIPYQTYSALFTFEFVRWVAGQPQRDCAQKLRIGVIAPYRAQAKLLNRLNDSWATKPHSVEIQVGTIHGFQGDECDIIIAVLNPPPTISTDSRMFLNRQNILNVAISRARDYLFIVIPDDETEGVEKLHKIARIEELVRAGGAFGEYASCRVEEMIWGDPNYLEQNTFSTGHQMVNVYRKPERYYEVRSDESAIDVQIYET